MGWDNLVIGNIDELYDTEFEGVEVMTALDGTKKLKDIKWGGTTLKGVVDEVTLNSDYVYLMGGNVVDIKKARALGVFENVLDKIRYVNAQDHMAILAIFAGKIRRIGKKWNRLLESQTNKVLEDDRLIHFNGGNKPWNSRKLDNLWYKHYASWGDLSGASGDNIIMIFSKPRSGSTLLMRLLNECLNGNRLKVRCNGEMKIWGNLLSMSANVMRFFKVDKKYKEESFPSNFYGGVLPQYSVSVLSMLKSICGASNGETIGFKEVDYAWVGHEYPNEIIKMLRLVAPTKVVWLDRPTTEVMASLKKTNWGNEARYTEEALEAQGYHLSRIDKDVVVTYQELLSYPSFAKFIAKLGLSITEGAYNKIIAKKLK